MCVCERERERERVEEGGGRKILGRQAGMYNTTLE